MLSVIKQFVILSEAGRAKSKDLPAKAGHTHIRVRFLAALGMTLVVFGMPFLVRAQACPPGSVDCGAGCVPPVASTSCAAADGRTGTTDACGTCTNLNCPTGQTLCTSTTGTACRTNATTCPGSNRSYNACTGCGDCATGFTNCGDTSAYNCQANTSTTCASPRIYNPCATPPTCTEPYIIVNPATPQSGFFNVSGNGNIGTDLWMGNNIYLIDGRALRVDRNGETSLSVGNYNSPAAGETRSSHNFQFRLHSQTVADRAELVFDQGGDRWALSSRDTSNNLEIWRYTGGAWAGPVMSIDYGTGNVTIGGTLTVGGASVITQPVSCTGGQVLQWNGTAWICATPASPWARITGFPAACSSGQYVIGLGSMLTCATPSEYYLQTGDTRNLSIGDSLYAYRIFPATGSTSVQLGASTSTINIPGNGTIGGTLTVGGASVITQPVSCTGGQVLQWSGTAWTCAAPASSLSGGVANKLAFWTGTGTLSQNTNLHWDNVASRLGIGTASPGAQLQINASTLNEGLRIVSASDWSPFNIRNSANTTDIFRVDQAGALQAGTVPWARITGFPGSVSTFDPCTVNIVRSISSAATATQGNAGGYTGANAICGGSTHVCTSEEILHTINCGVSIAAFNGRNGWVSGGPPGHTSLGNDCQGWTDSTSAALGRVWTFNSTGGIGIDTPCNAQLSFVCCQ